MPELQESLQAVSLFQHFNPDQLAQVQSLGQHLSLPANTSVFEQGDPADCLYVILEGEVRVLGKDPSGQEVELSTLGPGDFFGELALVDGGTRSAAVRSLSPCAFFILNREGFIRVLTGSPELLSTVLADISSKVRSSNEKIYKEMLERQNVLSQMEIERHRSLAQMVAGVAHEINTPLGIVNVAASMITENLTPEMLDSITDEDLRTTLDDIQEAAQLMQSNIARANHLIQTFKSVSVNQITDTLEEVVMAKLLQEIIDLFRIKARMAGIQINCEIDPAIAEGKWHSYPGYLSQVLMNLLTNIERYAYPDGVGGKVDVRLSGADTGYCIEVQDYGQGMPAEDAARIFEVFFTTGRSRGGTGLGMSIVHNLVTSALEGDIQVRSAPGEGTCVTLTLPRAVSQANEKG
ncbi:MAG: cyclic nucleotide-binding domain-containing protein [Candidatus Sericytochromatia bacterium]|nr:cyclic nucleotide-binding domain-containing protein [Candidatus Sericytochromatia bacterium]